MTWYDVVPPLRQPAPRLDFSTCRSAALAARGAPPSNASRSATLAADPDVAEPETTASSSRAAPSSSLSLCAAAAAGVSAALCGLNCECCAADVRLPGGGGFHGTLLRSPRAHVLSQFSHCHVAHHGTWRRAASDVTLFLAESILRATEHACGSGCTPPDADWHAALEAQLAAPGGAEEEEESADGGGAPDGGSVRVISLANTQAHALTCSKARGSFGHHFRRLDAGVSCRGARARRSVCVAARMTSYVSSREEAM